MTQAQAPALLARGPWAAEQVRAVWRDEAFVADDAKVGAADAAVAALRDRGAPSHDGGGGRPGGLARRARGRPSHDGVGARLVGFATEGDALRLELQPLRWALRLVDGD